ncbi:ATP-binding protein, partial [Cerasibacillus sp.]|uniref:ATP-binding protein n=1 Tax=Cerasibacillus sp. TaxID=2498711 RepID=UPI0032C227B3
FYRSDKDFTKQHFGLGLYTSKKICEKHGGELILDNNKRGGASITASFQFKS